MRKHFVLVVAALLLLAAGMLTLSGCNTWRGAGKDVENTGDSMQGH